MSEPCSQLSKGQCAGTVENCHSLKIEDFTRQEVLTSTAVRYPPLSPKGPNIGNHNGEEAEDTTSSCEMAREAR